MISFIAVGRNDNYEGGFLERFYTATSKNLETIKELGVEFEYLLVEWSPIRKLLVQTEIFKPLFAENKELKDIAVQFSVAIAEGLDPTMFYEYFAKNVGIRMSKYDSLVIMNSDIVIPPDLMKTYIELAQKGLDNNYYKPLFRVPVDHQMMPVGEEFQLNTGREDSAYSGNYPGDVFLASKQAIIDFGKGYDETNPAHRRDVGQVAMDTEIMHNLHANGCICHWLDLRYFHINHTKTVQNDGHCNPNRYANKTNWGFMQYNKNVVSDNLIVIS